MAQRRPAEDTYINSIVGPGTFFRGHLELSGLLRIDGDFSGSVVTDGRVIVGQAGRADCAIEAGTVVVGGLFKGEILAYEKVVLLASSVVVGSISAPRLIVEEGVLLSGRFRVTGNQESLTRSQRQVTSRKELLLESVRKRETSRAVTSQGSGAAGSELPGSMPARTAVEDASPGSPASESEVAVSRGTRSAWNE